MPVSEQADAWRPVAVEILGWGFPRCVEFTARKWGGNGGRGGQRDAKGMVNWVKRLI